MDTKKIKQIIELFEESKLARLELEVDGIKIGMEKPKEEIKYVSSPSPVTSVIPAINTQEDEQIDVGAIKSPLVGTFYAASSAGKNPFVEVGSNVKKGDTICIIEAMKVMNEIKANKDGKVTSIQAKDGETVQFDDVLMCIV